MSESRLQGTLAAIRPVSAALEPLLRAHLDDLTKPRGSLGRLEDVAVRLGLIRDGEPSVGAGRIVTFAADHGVAAEGVSAYPAEVTPQMVRNMLAGGAAVNVLARHAGMGLRVVDVGVNDDLADAPGLVRRKVRRGTANMTREPAMTPVEALAALDVGIELADEAARDGVGVLGTGEMGIGNTTAASAIHAALLPVGAAEAVGRGTGIDDLTLARKVRVVEQSLAAHRRALGDPLAALAAVGGLEIAGIAGLVLGAAAHRIAVVIDGFISGAGALVALRLAPAALDYMIFSHLSDESGHRRLFDALGVKPLLDLNLRLGEGTGAALAFPLLEAAVRLYREMATFSGAGVSDKTDRFATNAGGTDGTKAAER